MINDIVCMYACPTVDWTPKPFEYPIETITTSSPIKKNIDYYKEEFKRLVKEMEMNLGLCKNIEIKHNEENIEVDINF